VTPGDLLLGLEAYADESSRPEAQDTNRTSPRQYGRGTLDVRTLDDGPGAVLADPSPERANAMLQLHVVTLRAAWR
jgi:hypothetical protein